MSGTIRLMIIFFQQNKTMKQGDIVLTNFPFNSFTASKIGPALIVSNDNFNRSIDMILVSISTKENEYSYPLDQVDLFEGKLHKKSYVKFSNIFSFEKRLLIKKVASLKKDALKNIIEKLITNFK